MAKTSGSWIDDVISKYGKMSVFSPSDVADGSIDVIDSGSIKLNSALGIGGYPRGRIIEIVGNQGSGKSTLCLHAIASAQRLGLKALYVDAEHSLDPSYAEAIGVDLDNLLVSQPDYGEQGLDIAEKAIRSGDIGIVIFDSVAAMVPKAELEGEAGDIHVGLQARMMSQAMRRMSGAIHTNNVLAIFVNQFREKVGTFGFGSNKTTPGGHALRYYASVRMELARTQNLVDKGVAFAQTTQIHIVKNKLAPPYRKVVVDILFGSGLSRLAEIVDLGVEHGLIKKKGSWYTINDESVQGKQGAYDYLAMHPNVAEELKNEIEDRLGLRR